MAARGSKFSFRLIQTKKCEEETLDRSQSNQDIFHILYLISGLLWKHFGSILKEPPKKKQKKVQQTNKKQDLIIMNRSSWQIKVAIVSPLSQSEIINGYKLLNFTVAKIILKSEYFRSWVGFFFCVFLKNEAVFASN